MGFEILVDVQDSLITCDRYHVHVVRELRNVCGQVRAWNYKVTYWCGNFSHRARFRGSVFFCLGVSRSRFWNITASFGALSKIAYHFIRFFVTGSAGCHEAQLDFMTSLPFPPCIYWAENEMLLPKKTSFQCNKVYDNGPTVPLMSH